MQRYLGSYTAASVLDAHQYQELKAVVMLHTALLRALTPRQIAHMVMAYLPNRPDPVQVARLLVDFGVGRADDGAGGGDTGHVLPPP